jgi:hypothetical protein
MNTSTTNNTQMQHDGPSRRSPLMVVMVMTLAIFAGVLIARFHARPGASPAQPFDVAAAFAGGTVSQTGGLTILTSEAGNEDLLVVLDARNEELFVYRADVKNGLQLLQRYPVAQLFTDARARTTGGP